MKRVKKHPVDCFCADCHERDYWQRHPPGTHCACIDCVERWEDIDPPPPNVKSRNPYAVMYFPHEWEDEQ